MISNSDIKKLLGRDPAFDDIMCSLQSVPRMPRGIVKETRRVMAYVRKFNDEYVREQSLDVDRACQEQDDLLPWDLVEEANRRGLYSMWIPRLFGGRGYNLGSLSYALEELASVCTGIANVVGVHYLGVTVLFSTWNMRVINRVLRETVEGEKTGKPCILSLAITEPSAGTDVEDVELVDRGTVTCFARRVKGGYVLNGRKVFISMGHVSTWHIIIAYTDLKKPSENMMVCAVKTGTKGFSFGRKEHKMGQLACPASELLFEDCFVPDELVCYDNLQTRGCRSSKKKINRTLINLILSASRAGVAAFGAGVARGAFEEALRFASGTTLDNRLLLNHEWVQCMLAEMYKNAALARLGYAESNYANGLYGMVKLLQKKPLYYMTKYTPARLMDKFCAPVMNMNVTTRLFRKIYFDWIRDEDLQRATGWASLAKFSATDLGVTNCHMALELMGQAGLRHDGRAEKHLRDAKLLQIYEGTNQLNRLTLFDCLIGRSTPGRSVFEE